MPSVPTAALLAIASAASLGTAMITMRIGLRYASPAAGAAIGVPSTALMFWCLAPFFLDLDGFNSTAAATFALVGLFFPATVTFLTYYGTHRMGPTINSAISCTTPLFALVGAILFLKEFLTTGIMLGTAGIILGMLALTWNKADIARNWPLWAIALPITGAAIRALAQVLTKAGLAVWASPYAAGLIGYTVSAFIILIVARVGGAKKPADRRATPWFIATGLLNGGGVFLTYAALNAGPLAIVSPIVATYPLFTLALTLMLLRQERITPRIATGVTLTVSGVIVLLLL